MNRAERRKTMRILKTYTLYNSVSAILRGRTLDPDLVVDKLPTSEEEGSIEEASEV